MSEDEGALERLYDPGLLPRKSVDARRSDEECLYV